jgi:hypothetical protein
LKLVNLLVKGWRIEFYRVNHGGGCTQLMNGFSLWMAYICNELMNEWLFCANGVNLLWFNSFCVLFFNGLYVLVTTAMWWYRASQQERGVRQLVIYDSPSGWLGSYDIHRKTFRFTLWIGH